MTTFKRAVSAALALMLCLLLLPVAAEAPAITGKELVDQLLTPIALKNRSSEFDAAEIQEIVRQAAAQGYVLSPGYQRALSRAKSYDKGELALVFLKPQLGPYTEAWGIEDQHWFNEYKVNAGLLIINTAALPMEGELSQQEIEDKAVAIIQEKVGQPLPLHDRDRYRLSRSFSTMKMNPYQTVRSWTLSYDAISYREPSFHLSLTPQGELKEWTSNLEHVAEIPGMDKGQQIMLTVDGYLSRYGGPRYELGALSQEDWQALRKMLDAYLEGYEVKDGYYDFILKQQYGPAPAGSLTREQAVEKALLAVADHYGPSEEELREGPDSYLSPEPYIYAILLKGEGAYRWKVSFGQDYLVEVDAVTGEIEEIDVYSPGNNFVRRFVLDELLPEMDRAYATPYPVATATPSPQPGSATPYPQPQQGVERPQIYWDTLQALNYNDESSRLIWDDTIREYGYDKRFWPQAMQALDASIYSGYEQAGEPLVGIPLPEDISAEEALATARKALPDVTSNMYKQAYLDSLKPALTYYYDKPSRGRRSWEVTFFELRGEDVTSLATVLVDAYSGQLIPDPSMPLKEGEYRMPPMGKDKRPLIWGDQRIPAYYWEMMEKRQDTFESVARLVRETEQNTPPGEAWPILVTALHDLWLNEHSQQETDLEMAGLPGPEDIPQEKALEIAWAAFRKATEHKYPEEVFNRLEPIPGFMFNNRGPGSRTWRFEFFDPGRPGYVTLGMVSLDAVTGELVDLHDQPGNG